MSDFPASNELLIAESVVAYMQKDGDHHEPSSALNFVSVLS